MRKPRHLLAALLTAAAALVVTPAREAQACSWCASSIRCEPANYSGCATRTLKVGTSVCESWYANCAWVYDVTNVVPNGTLVASAGAEDPQISDVVTENGRTVERACGGVVVSRQYSARAETEVRAATASLVI